jgi:hypothetical protein
MHPSDPWDAVHLEGARQVDEFSKALARAGDAKDPDGLRHADNANVFVEYLANTFPKLPRDATERDAWLFLFDYVIAQGPFVGRTAEIAPRSLWLFMEFVAQRERVAEMPFIRAACSQEELFARRLAAFDAMARHSQGPHAEDALMAAALDAWWGELDALLWERGLIADAALAGGEERWSHEMGPVEMAVFDAVCTVLSRRARELHAAKVTGEGFDRELLALQREFMTRRNPGLGTSPLDAVLRERASPVG